MQRLCAYRFALAYLVCAEAVYLLYEWQLPSGPHLGNALALALVLGALSLPAGVGAGWIQWHAAVWLGYAPGDTKAFWPRLIAWQAALLVNFVLRAAITKKPSPSSGGARSEASHNDA